MSSKFLLTAFSVLALSSPALAADDHGHDDGAAHFSVEKPADASAAWTLLDSTIAAAQKAVAENNSNVLHESGEKLEAAVAALGDHADKGNQKLTQALEQLTKTVDRFHHAAEDNDKAGATESLEIMTAQRDLVKSLYK